MPNKEHLALFLRSLAGVGPALMQLNLARAFAARGHRVDLVLARAEGPYLQAVPPSVKVIDLEAKNALVSLSMALRDWRVFWALAPVLLDTHPPRVLGGLAPLVRYLRREQPTALLTAQHYGNITALCAIRLAGIRTRLVISQRTQLSVYAQKGIKRRKRLALWSIRHCYPWADDIVAVSNGVADDLAVNADIPRQRITTIYNPVVTPELSDKARAPLLHPWFGAGSPPVVLGAGRLHYQKDFPTLLRAFARVRALQPARLVILGAGPERAALETLTRELGIAAEVDWPGFVENPFAYMARAAVFALSSVYEGLPGVLIQALACGCPVVSTDCPSGPREILNGGDYGLLIPVGDDAALAQAIRAVLATPPQRERLRARAALFSVAHAADRYLESMLA